MQNIEGGHLPHVKLRFEKHKNVNFMRGIYSRESTWYTVTIELSLIPHRGEIAVPRYSLLKLDLAYHLHHRIEGWRLSHSRLDKNALGG